MAQITVEIKDEWVRKVEAQGIVFQDFLQAFVNDTLRKYIEETFEDEDDFLSDEDSYTPPINPIDTRPASHFGKHKI